ncbi:MAG: phosphatase PAP2 family protein [Oscillospiraceae bacterium]
MKKRTRHHFSITAGLLAAFVLWTIAVRRMDVQAIGPKGSSVGFAALNGFVHNLTGVHWTIYTITDWLGLVPLCFALGFALLGLRQLIQRRSLLKVDRSLLVLGGFYLLVMAAYLFFETFVINYRPVLINGCLEASYPSSTTMLVMCVMPTAMMQLHDRIRSKTVRKVILGILAAFTAFMVIARLISGVHWLTDIVAGTLLSAGLVMLYHTVNDLSGPKA